MVSLPCVEWFQREDAAYREEVLPPELPKVVVEAGVTTGWKDLLGGNTEAVGVDQYGQSAAGGVIFEKYGVTADAVVEKALGLIG